MTLRIVDTPLPTPVPELAPRAEAWRSELEPALLPGPGAAATLARLREAGAQVVTTGQQPGLFVGPAYVIYKALSARALARQLTARWRRPVVPVYWVPGDDHDLTEVAGASWIAGDGALVSVQLASRPAEAPLTPLCREPLGDQITGLLGTLEQSLPASDDRAHIIGWLRRHYRPGATVAGAFGLALAELLAPLGVLCLDSTHGSVKAAARPLLLQALEQAAPIEADLAARAEELAAMRIETGVTLGDGAALVFIDGPLGRDRLVRDDGGFHLRRSRERLSLADIARLSEADPRRLSANVLLRPVLESALLPTVAYIAGPGELRYLELARPIYQRLGITRQVPVPRWSGLMVEPRITRLLDKLGATLDELGEPGLLEERIARAALPPETTSVLATLRDLVARGYDPVIRTAAAVDPTLERPATAAKGQAFHAIGELEKKLLQHARKREALELGQVARARASVRPGGKPQERVLTLAGFFARYGTGLLDDLASHVDAWYARALEGAHATT